MKKLVAKIVLGAMLISVVGTTSTTESWAAKKKPKLAKKSVKVMVKKSKKVKVKYGTKKTKVRIKASKQCKKIAKVTWQKKKKSLNVVGRKPGKSKVVVFLKEKEKTYRYSLAIQVVKGNMKKEKSETEGMNVVATDSPASTPVKSPETGKIDNSTPVATESASTSESTTKPVETSVPTATPKPLFVGNYEGDTEMPIKDIYKDYFMMGAAINGSAYENMALHHEGMTGILLKHFNSTVMSNLMKPQYTLNQAKSKASEDGMPVCSFETCDAALQFCMDNGLKMRGHTLVWHNQAPEWFFHEDYDVSKPVVDAETMDKRMESYIKQVLTHCQDNYPGVIYCWDVVNECVCTDANSYIVTEGGWKLRASTKEDNDFVHEDYQKNYWYATMGEGYVEKAFTYARKYADKDVKLFYNDYNPFVTEKMENIYMMCEQLKEKGLIDGIGLQPTVGLNWPAELNSDKEGSFKVCLDTYAKLGLEIQITELGFKIDDKYLEDEDSLMEKTELQNQRYEEFMSLLLEMDSDNGGPCNITSVTVFGICDDYPLYDDFVQNLYLWDKNCLPKPCFYSFIKPGMDLLGGEK